MQSRAFAGFRVLGSLSWRFLWSPYKPIHCHAIKAPVEKLHRGCVLIKMPGRQILATEYQKTLFGGAVRTPTRVVFSL